MEESDEDMADTDGGKGNAYDEGEEDEIIESDLELEGETVEPDNDPPQQVFFSSSLNCIFYFINFFGCLGIVLMEDLIYLQMGDPSVEVTEESRDAAQTAKAKGMEAISEGI